MFNRFLHWLLTGAVWFRYFATKSSCIGCDNLVAVDSYLCGACYGEMEFILGVRPSGLNKIFYLCHYEGVIRKILTSYKYGRNINLCLILSDLTIQLITYFKLEPRYLTFVPSNRLSYVKKGFNHNFKICNIVASKLRLTLISDYFVKTRYTKAQAGLRRSARQRNIVKSFAVNKKYHNSVFDGLLIFDDISTTGSTFKVIARLMAKAGFRHDYICIAAREDKYFKYD